MYLTDHVNQMLAGAARASRSCCSTSSASKTPTRRSADRDHISSKAASSRSGEVAVRDRVEARRKERQAVAGLPVRHRSIPPDATKGGNTPPRANGAPRADRSPAVSHLSQRIAVATLVHPDPRQRPERMPRCPRRPPRAAHREPSSSSAPRIGSSSSRRPRLGVVASTKTFVVIKLTPRRRSAGVHSARRASASSSRTPSSARPRTALQLQRVARARPPSSALRTPRGRPHGNTLRVRARRSPRRDRVV